VSTLINPKQRLDILPFAPQKKTSDFGWSSVQVEDYKYLPPSDLNLPPMTHHILAFHYKPPTGLLKHYCADQHTTLQLNPRDITYVPAFADNGWKFANSMPNCMHILIEHRFLMQFALEAFDIDVTRIQFVDTPQIQDKQLQAFALLFQAEVDNGCQTGALYVESLTTALASYLLTYYTTSQLPKPSHTSNLSHQQLKQTLDYIHSRLKSTITLQQLADNIHLSTFHFSRQFKQVMGVSPYHYWQRVRLEAIQRELIQRPNDPIYQIAQEFGFNSPAYFTQQFRQMFGISPTQYRQRNA